MSKRDIIAIGGSSGSLGVVTQLVGGLQGDTSATLFITTHMPPDAPSHLPDILASNSALPVSRAIHGMPIERGHVYIAAPGYHLLVLDGTIRLGSGPRENLSRPAIDPMFRSIALAYGARAVGVILSGTLNDGASGLRAIKSCGGTAIVQRPHEAQADEMPLAALESTDVDYVCGAAEMAATLMEVAGLEAGPTHPGQAGLALEVSIAGGARVGSETLRQLADPAPLSCPDCHGALSEVRGDQPLRFRCQIGHAYTAKAFASRIEEVDQAMHIALRMMEERVTLVTRMAQDARSSSRAAVAEVYEARAAEYARYAEVLRSAALESLRLGTVRREQEQ